MLMLPFVARSAARTPEPATRKAGTGEAANAARAAQTRTTSPTAMPVRADGPVATTTVPLAELRRRVAPSMAVTTPPSCTGSGGVGRFSKRVATSTLLASAAS